MAWTWVLQLVPLVDDIAKGVGNLIGKKKEKKVIDSIKTRFANFYAKNFEMMNRDIALIQGWKPILAPIQGIDIVLNRWEYISILGKKYNNPQIALDQVTSESVNLLITKTQEVETKMQKLSGASKLNWMEGSPSLIASLDRLKRKLNDLKNDLNNNSTPQEKLEDLKDNARECQEETISFFAFWDSVLNSLSLSATEGSKAIKENLGSLVEGAAKTIVSEYPRETWGSLVSSIIDQIDLDTEE